MNNTNYISNMDNNGVKCFKSKKGVSLTVLVITIIVALLLLSGVGVASFSIFDRKKQEEYNSYISLCQDEAYKKFLKKELNGTNTPAIRELRSVSSKASQTPENQYIQISDVYLERQAPSWMKKVPYNIIINTSTLEAYVYEPRSNARKVFPQINGKTMISKNLTED